MENEIPPTRKGFQKLFSEPVEIDMFPEYKMTQDKKAFIPVQESKLKVWIHPLKADEWTFLESVGIEAFRMFKAKGGSDDDATWNSNRVQGAQHVMTVLRVGPKEDSAMLYQNELEALQLPSLEVDRIIGVYNAAFVPNRTESKNCLRERLGLGSETPSTSPATSETQG